MQNTWDTIGNAIYRHTLGSTIWRNAFKKPNSWVWKVPASEKKLNYWAKHLHLTKRRRQMKGTENVIKPQEDCDRVLITSWSQRSRCLWLNKDIRQVRNELHWLNLLQDEDWIIQNRMGVGEKKVLKVGNWYNQYAEVNILA